MFPSRESAPPTVCNTVIPLKSPGLDQLVNLKTEAISSGTTGIRELTSKKNLLRHNSSIKRCCSQSFLFSTQRLYNI